MSIQALSVIAKHQPLPASLAGFLFTLAYHHNVNTNTCNPSIDRLCEQLQSSRRTVLRFFAEAEGRGLIKRKAQFINGRQCASQITFPGIDLGVSQLTPRGVMDDTLGGVTADTGGGVTTDTLGGVTTDTQKRKEEKKYIHDQRFTEFWSAYPKKVGKKAAEKAFRNLTVEKQQKAIADCATRYVNTPRQYIPNPTTYLHGERWEDEPPTPQDGDNTDPWAEYSKGGI